MADDLGRATRAYVSGYQRDRIHSSSLVRGEKRPLTANFNGAIPVGRSIVSATWRTNQYQAVVMSQPAIDGRETTVLIEAGWGGYAQMKCQVTLDNGEVYNQIFDVSVRSGPWYQGETYNTSGPQSLTVQA